MTEQTEPDDLAARQRAALDRLRPPCCRDSDHPDGCPQHNQALSVTDPRRARRSRRRPDPSKAAPPAPDGPDAA